MSDQHDTPESFLSTRPPWQDRLRHFTELMRHVSVLSDPQEMVRAYGTRMREILGHDGYVALSRRNVQPPQYRVTRSPILGDIDPWKNPEQLPVLAGGLLGQLMDAGEGTVLHDICLMPDDPASRFMPGARSLMALPQFDNGRVMNMTITYSHKPYWFDKEALPELVWSANLFGRATNNLVLSRDLGDALALLDRELDVVAQIQRSLLPQDLPTIETLDIAAHYRTSSHAGGDYYDFFELADGSWGILIADVSGHGTPAAVLMAITHAIAHLVPGGTLPPDRVLEFINEELVTRYTILGGVFVTAFYGIFDPKTQTLRYSLAGHPPPLVRRAGNRRPQGADRLTDSHAGLPLGIVPQTTYRVHEEPLHSGDAVLLYTDGLSEARGVDGALFGEARLMESLAAANGTAAQQLDRILLQVNRFCGDSPPQDDQTALLLSVHSQAEKLSAKSG